MRKHGDPGTGIRVLAVAGAFALATMTSVTTSSAAPGSAVALTGTAARMQGAVSAPMDMPMDMPMDTDPSEVPGMEMDRPAGTHDATAAPTQAPTSGDMPGMDMPADEHADGDAAGPAAKKPLVPVLGAFGGGTAAVMLTAGMMRRKDRERLQARQAARAARRSGK